MEVDLLQAKLEALQREVARKNALLQRNQSCEEVVLGELAQLLKFATEAKSSPVTDTESYPSLRELFTAGSVQLERAAIKICVGFESTAADRDARLALLKSLLGPMEIVVTSLSSVHGSVSVLQLACRTKAREVSQSCVAFVKALFAAASLGGKGEVSTAALCGSVEAICQEVRLLPVSNLAAVKRQLFEVCKSTVQDSAREFQDLHEAGGVGEEDFFGDEDSEEAEETADPVQEADLERLLAASECLGALKQLLMHICKQGLDGCSVSLLEQLSQHTKLVDTSCTDFSVEMYPRQDMQQVATQATKLLFAVEALVQLVPQASQDPSLFDSFKLKLALVVA
ncbi:hypothetical protein BASA81_005542 [Batrachochytrium salamandrivorans]|nr:hypothetical protein BASA81_005542 [Batrachochytrium salamandrivorans]